MMHLTLCDCGGPLLVPDDYPGHCVNCGRWWRLDGTRLVPDEEHPDMQVREEVSPRCSQRDDHGRSHPRDTAAVPRVPFNDDD